MSNELTLHQERMHVNLSTNQTSLNKEAPAHHCNRGQSGRLSDAERIFGAVETNEN
jgi:hypothetical protein